MNGADASPEKKAHIPFHKEYSYLWTFILWFLAGISWGYSDTLGNNDFLLLFVGFMILSIASLILLPWFQVPFRKDPLAWVIACWGIAAVIIGIGRFFDAGFLAVFILGFVLAGMVIAIKYRVEF